MNPLSLEPAARILCKLGYANAPVKSRANQRPAGLNKSQNQQELKSEKPLCYCSRSITGR